LTRLNRAQEQLDSLPPPADPAEAARRRQLEDAIRERRDALQRSNELLEEFIASDDQDERDNLQERIEDLRDDYRDTSGLGGGRLDDPCAPCTIQQDIWEIVEVTPSGDRKQYVNIDSRCRPRQRPRKHHGREIVVRARIQPRKRRKLVHFRVHTDPANRTLHFARAGNPTATPAVPQPALPASHHASVSPVSRLTNARGIATVRLQMGQYGGDKFQVSASRDAPSGPAGPTASGAAKRTGVFEVWRKLWYAQIQMRNPAGATWQIPAASIATVVNAYEQTFVELLDSGETRQGPHQENFESHALAYGWADRRTSRRYTPWKVVYSAVENCVPLSRRQSRTTPNINVTSAMHPLPGNYYPYNFRIGTRTTRRDWFVSATVTNLATGAVVNLEEGDFDLASTPHGPTQITLDLSRVSLTPTAANPLRLRLTYQHGSPANGWGGANLHLVICARSMRAHYGANTTTAMGGTCTHEPGHALGLVNPPLPWETTDAAHPRHCRERACVMWFQGYTGRPTTFHSTGDPNCHTYLRGRLMSRGNMRIWRFPR
jgi:hypothetical protein